MRDIAGDFVTHLQGQSYSSEEALVVALKGDLGGGKTTFTQGVARALGITEQVLSPTFTLMRSYEIPDSAGVPWNTFVHIDAYRLQTKNELRALVLEDILKKGSIVFIEWANNIPWIIPKDAITITFTGVDEHTRIIEILNNESREET
jgi:tRNA threonylcarbamoyladenosine biosynthesis protein TsaE